MVISILIGTFYPSLSGKKRGGGGGNLAMSFIFGGHCEFHKLIYTVINLSRHGREFDLGGSLVVII